MALPSGASTTGERLDLNFNSSFARLQKVWDCRTLVVVSRLSIAFLLANRMDDSKLYFCCEQNEQALGCLPVPGLLSHVSTPVLSRLPERQGSYAIQV